MLASTTPTAVDGGSASPDRLVSAQDSMQSGAYDTAEAAADSSTGMDMGRQSAGNGPAAYRALAGYELGAPAPGSASGLGPLWLPAGEPALPVEGASVCAVDEPEPSRGQASKRKVSAFFGGQHKRPRSAEAEELPVHASPHGLLGGLVSKLTPQPSCDECNSSADDSISVDLDAESCHVKKKGVSVARDDASDGTEEKDVETYAESIAGLEHIQPFASIANVAVSKVKAASLKKFGMDADSQKPLTHRHARSVLQPFAPPRRCNASQDGRHAAGCAQEGGLVAPSLQTFACLVGSNDRSRTKQHTSLSDQ